MTNNPGLYTDVAGSEWLIGDDTEGVDWWRLDLKICGGGGTWWMVNDRLDNE